MEASSEGPAASPAVSLRRRWGLARVIWATLVACLVLLGVVGGIQVIRLYPHVRSLVDQARALRDWAQDAESNLRSPAARAALRSTLELTRKDLATLRAEGGALWSASRHLGWLPLVGPDLESSPALLEAGIHLVDAGLAGLDGGEPVLAVYDAGSSVPPENAMAEALQQLEASGPRFAAAERAIASARAELESLPAHRLSPRIAAPVALVQRYIPILEACLRLVRAVPALLGAERPASYLILAQNEHELRPTGGLVSGVGLVRIERGKIITATLGDSYAADADCDYGLPAPAALREYMWAPALKLRDANWSPDFPSSVAVMRSIYRRCQGAEVDGAIAVDLEAVGAIIEVLGPLQPQGYPAPITRDTFQQVMSQYWTAPLGAQTMDENKDEWWLHRKDLMTDLFLEAVNKTTAPGSIPAKRLAQAMLRILQERHLQVYVDEPSAQQALASVGWDGSMQSSDGDYLLVVDSNVGFRKVNPYIDQRIDYRVDLAQGMAHATLALDYSNTSPGSAECIAGARYDKTYSEMMQGCYWDYVRVYIPRGSRLLGVEGGDSAASITEERGKAVLGLLLIVPPGRSRRLLFTYDVPLSGGGASHYDLLVQRQAGSREIPVQVSVSSSQLELGCWNCPFIGAHGDNSLSTVLVADLNLSWQEDAN